jgi:hypothetical protein
MKQIAIISFIITAVAVGWLAWRWHSPQPKPTPVVHQSAARHLAPEGTYFLIQRVALTTDSGVVGFAPGTKVNLATRTDSISTVTVKGYNFDVPSSQLTNDLDIAASAAQSDFSAQTKISQLTSAQARQYAQQQGDANAALAKEEERRHKAAPQWANPLERGPYNNRRQVFRRRY